LLAKDWNPIWLELGTRVGFHLQNKYTRAQDIRPLVASFVQPNKEGHLIER
jgi:hypothetical protein